MFKKVIVAGLAIGAGVGVAYWLMKIFSKDPVEDPVKDEKVLKKEVVTVEEWGEEDVIEEWVELEVNEIVERQLLRRVLGPLRGSVRL